MPAPTPTPSKTRSWLFAPGDSPRKMENAAGGAADIVILDLEDAVATANKPEARRMIAEFLRANEQDRARLWGRVNPLDGDWTAEDLDAAIAGCERVRDHVASLRRQLRLREELEILRRDNDRLKRIKKAEELQLPQSPAASPRKKRKVASKVTGAASGGDVEMSEAPSPGT